MTGYLLLSVIVVAACISFVKWRWGLAFFLLVGVLQDPLRKVIPGVPSFIVLATVPILMAMFIGLMNSRDGSWNAFRRPFPIVGNIVGIFLFCLVPPAFLSATYGPGSWMFTIIGLLSAFILVAGILVGFFYAKDQQGLEKALIFYCIFTAVMCVGTFFEYFNVGLASGLVGDYRMGFTWIRHLPGIQIRLMAGFYRSSDVMGWHAATLVMLALALWLYRKNPWWLLPAAIGFLALLLSGRRKMVYLVPVFVVVIAFASYYLKRMRGAVSAVFLLLMVGLFGISVYRGIGMPEEHLFYYTSDPMDAVTQLEEHGFESLMTTYRQSGFFGEGLGFAATGAHNLPADRPRIWQESGVSKIMVEIGVPGFVSFVLLQLALLAAGWRALKRPGLQRTPAFFLYLSLFALVVANDFQFLVSGQIYGDPFVASLFSIMVGAMLSSVRLHQGEPSPGRPAAPALRRA